MAAAAEAQRRADEQARRAAEEARRQTENAGRSISRGARRIFSDVRLKTNIELLGKSLSGINIYKFSYIGSSIEYSGVMAQEVPWATEMHTSGYLMVDYNKVDVVFKRLN